MLGEYSASAAFRLGRSATASRFEHPALLGAHYSILLCMCSYCICTSRVFKPSTTAPSSISVQRVVCAALMRSSFVRRASCYAQHTQVQPVALVRAACVSHAGQQVSQTAHSTLWPRPFSPRTSLSASSCRDTARSTHSVHPASPRRQLDHRRRHVGLRPWLT
jgi:hypothetical protein